MSFRVWGWTLDNSYSRFQFQASRGLYLLWKLSFFIKADFGTLVFLWDSKVFFLLKFADEVTFVFTFSSLSSLSAVYNINVSMLSRAQFLFHFLRQIYAKWKLFSKYRPLYIYLFMFPNLRLHSPLHWAFKSFLCLRIFFVSVPGSQLVGRNTLLSTAPPLSASHHHLSSTRYLAQKILRK